MESIWRKECSIAGQEALKKDITADVAIIGAGMAGILTAYLLKEKGIEAVILEANEIASGQTQNTTAKITSQHSYTYENLIQDFGREKAHMYAMVNQEAIGRYENLIEGLGISCHSMFIDLKWFDDFF